MSNPLRMVVYLDIDDVLIRWEGRHREASPHAATFVRFLLDHFEVRWLTSWCPGGEMRDDRVLTLAEILGIEAEMLHAIRNPRAFPGQPFGSPPKYHGIGFGDRWPWVWIEDEKLHRINMDELERRGMRDRYIECNTSLRPEDLLRVRALLEARFDLSSEEQSQTSHSDG